MNPDLNEPISALNLIMDFLGAGSLFLLLAFLLGLLL